MKEETRLVRLMKDVSTVIPKKNLSRFKEIPNNLALLAGLLAPSIEATAEPTGGVAAQGGIMPMAFTLIVFAAIFYFILYRPQANRVKAHRALMASLAKGDEVMTSGGLMGTITKIIETSDCLVLQLTPSVEILIKKDFVTTVLPKGTIQAL